MFDKEFDIAEVIARSQKQELTERDKVLLKEWLESDLANPVVLASLSDEALIRDKMKSFEAPNSEVLWGTVIQKLSDQRSTSQPVRKLWPRIAVAAAIATIIFGAGLFYYNLNLNKAQPNQTAYKNDVAPGKTGATLTLASGKKVRLGDAANGELATEAGVNISKSADGKLIYEIAENATGENKINTLSTGKGETYQVRLPDGSLIALNATSSLEYPVNFNTLKERRVKLKGEGYFEIAKDKVHPFIVETDKQEVEVLGTHFNINSYTDEPAIATTLIEGSVKVSSNGNTKILKPGEQALNNGSTIKTEKANIDNITDWKDDEFNLDRVNFKVAMRKIARWYDVEVIYNATVSDDLEAGGWISRNEKLSAVLKSIESAGFVHFRIEGRKIYVSQ